MPIRILLIEDSMDHALLTKKILEGADAGYQIDHAREAAEGVRRVFQRDYDLILCDYRLPGSSALDILREMKTKGKDLPFVVTTSSGSEKIAVELMKEGAYDYLNKDEFFQDALPMVVRRAIDRYKVNKEKERLEKELKESNKKLKQLYEIKSNFTSMVSHELRTPLTAIKEGISLVLDGTAGEVNDRQKEFLDMAKQNVDRLNRLVNDVLDFSKLEAKKLVFKMAPGDINGVINEVMKIQSPVAREKSLYFKGELNTQMPRIEFDADRINQVLNNLISNAIKFTHAGGITVLTSKNEEENMVTVDVKDTGEGIRQEDLPKLFQRFQQLDGVQTETDGTGLGLAICKEIINQHGGRIWVESEHGRGSTFRFALPIVRRYKILVIDDEEVVLDACEELLKRGGYLVLRTQEAGEGIRISQSDKPDLIMLDMRLKDTNGYEVIGRLRSRKETQDIPILVITGYMEEVEKIESRPEGLALPWLSKPFNNDEFLSRVKSLLRPGVGGLRGGESYGEEANTCH